MKKGVLVILSLCLYSESFSWGFYAHRLINYQAVFLLPPEMLILYKKNISYLSDHSVDPDKRRYAVAAEGPRHYIDMDRYGPASWSVPRKWNDALAKYGADSLNAHGIVPWWIQTMLYRLTDAFRKKELPRILRLSAEIGHYIGDAHVPLHACSNHNGQFTNQQGIHGFWESRIPELRAADQWELFTARASYLSKPLDFIWDRVIESAKAADTVLAVEKKLSDSFPSDKKYAFEQRNGQMIKQYSSAYCEAYESLCNNMGERRMQQAIFSVASFWYTAWVDAGQPDLKKLAGHHMTGQDAEEFEELNRSWRNEVIKGRSCD